MRCIAVAIRIVSLVACNAFILLHQCNQTNTSLYLQFSGKHVELIWKNLQRKGGLLRNIILLGPSERQR
jgi:hypothetical protein